MKLLKKINGWISYHVDHLVFHCHPIWLILIIIAGFLSAAYILCRTIGTPRFLPEGYVYKITYRDWVFYTDDFTRATHSSLIEFEDIRTRERIKIGSDYIITQVPQEHARDKTYGRAGDIPQEDSEAR